MSHLWFWNVSFTDIWRLNVNVSRLLKEASYRLKVQLRCEVSTVGHESKSTYFSSKITESNSRLSTSNIEICLLTEKK